MNNRPFPETLIRLLDERGWSMRHLAQQLQEDFDGWGSIGTLSQYNTGKIRPTMKALERIAYSLKVEPEAFAEYRLVLARTQLDPEAVGLAVALKNLERFEGR